MNSPAEGLKHLKKQMRAKKRAPWPLMQVKGIVTEISDFVTLTIDPVPDVWHILNKLDTSGKLTLYFSLLNKRVKDLAIGGLYEFTVGVTILKSDGVPKLGFLYLSHIKV